MSLTARYGLVQTVAPVEEPLSLPEVKTFLRVDDNDEDDLLLSLIRTARDYAERHTSRQLVTATWRLTLDEFPWYDGDTSYGDLEEQAIRLPKAPLQSVSQITYVDTSGATQVLAATEYTVDTDLEPGRVAPAYGKTWPSTRATLNAVKVTYVAGYGAASAVPDAIKSAMRLLIGQWYENREPVQKGAWGLLPLTVDHLLSPFWVGEYH